MDYRTITSLDKFAEKFSQFEGIPISIYCKSNNGKYLNVNKQMIEFAGLQEQREMVGKYDSDFHWKTHAKEYTQNDKLALKQRKLITKIEATSTIHSPVVMALSLKYPIIDSKRKFKAVLCFTLFPNEYEYGNQLVELLGKLYNAQLITSANQHKLVLTLQEKNCLIRLAEGRSVKEIAGILKLSPRTVESYLINCRYKYGVNNNKELLVTYFSNPTTFLQPESNKRYYLSGKYESIYLTTSEYEIVKKLLAGYTTKTLSVLIQRTPQTIEKHLENIKKKLGCYSKMTVVTELAGFI